MTNRDSDEPRKNAGGDSNASNDTSVPFAPRKDDDTAVGSTDQHSKADHSKDPADDIKTGNAAND